MDDYFVRALTKMDTNDVKRYLYHYLEVEVTTKSLGLTQDDKMQFVEAYVDVETVIAHGVSFGVFQTSDESMCGCFLISKEPYTTITPETTDQFGAPSERFWQLLRFEKFMEQNIKEIAGGMTYLLINVSIVDFGHMRKGLASRILKRVDSWAIKSGISSIFAYTMNRSMLRLLRKHEYIPVKEVMFKDYRDPVTGEVVFNDV